MADQQDATSADVEISATEDDVQADDFTSSADGADADTTAGDENDDAPLGEAGTKALQAEKEKRRLAARQRREAVRERDEALAELARLKAAAESANDGGDAAPDLDALRAEAEETARATVKAEMLAERVSDKIEVLAAKRFQNADDALAQLMRSNEVDDFLNGDKIDVEAITEALDELLEKKPYLAVAAQSGAKRFQGSGDGGARKGPVGPSQITESELKRMSPEAIVKAQQEGRLDNLMGSSS